MIGRFCRVTLAVCLAILTGIAPVAPAFAQQEGQATPAGQTQPQAPARTIEMSNQQYSFGKRWFPNVLAPYTPTPVPEPILTNGPRIDQMIKDGKLTISLQDAIDLALQNNLDISIQRYIPWLAEANILRTRSGAASSGGTIGSLGNIPAQNFDPQVTSTWSLDDRDVPVNNGLTSGASANAPGTAATFAQLKTHTTIGNIAYTQGFHTGSSFSAAFNNTRASSTSASNFFSPSVTSQFILIGNQQLLNGFGRLANERYILIAKLNKNIADQTFRQQVITSITAVSNAYWELVFARGNVDVALHQIELANKLYSDNKKQVDIGTLAPLEIVQAEAQVATANQTLIIDQTTLLEDQLTLLSLITKDPETPALRAVEIIPTDTADTAPPDVEKIPLEDLIKEAVTKRPDVLTSATTLQGDDINVRVTKNALLPVVNLSAEYASQGLAGTSHPCTPGTTNCAVPPPQMLTGLVDSLGDMFGGVYPEFNAAITLTIPIRNRAAQANNVTALLDKRMDETRYRQTLNNVAIDVHNTQIVLGQARVTVDAAVKTRDLDQQTLDAEQKKYQLGASTLFNVVSDQNILAAAASAEVRARVNLAEAKVNFDRAMARTLEVYNVTIADAKSGSVPKDTLIPGTTAAGQLVVEPVKQAAPSSAAASSPSAVAKQ
jgi:outer membrane protein TolC